MVEEISGAKVPTIKVLTNVMVRVAKAGRVVAIVERTQKTSDEETVP